MIPLLHNVEVDFPKKGPKKERNLVEDAKVNLYMDAWLGRNPLSGSLLGKTPGLLLCAFY